MDCALSPVQQRNLEKAWGAKVIDRTGLILEIFGRRASTREGTLQVEHAHLAYQKSRLVRSWTHLERQRGGFGFLGGPGETQIEADRRMIQERMTRIERDLDAVVRTRGLHRQSRARVPYPIVALVGYTNAGKSSLFNALTRAEVTAKDMLFATLDPTARATKLPHGETVILSDTVGFISDLPTPLIAAFRATLEDAIEADVLLHVRDVSHVDSEAQAEDVGEVLRELGIETSADRIIEVWNKADLLDDDERTRLLNLSGQAKARNDRDSAAPVLVSALTGEGLAALAAADRGADRAPPVELRGGPAAGGRGGAQLALRERRDAGPPRRGRRHAAPRGPDRPREGAALPQPLRGGPAARPGRLMVPGGVGSPRLPGLARAPAESRDGGDPGRRRDPARHAGGGRPAPARPAHRHRAGAADGGPGL